MGLRKRDRYNIGLAFERHASASKQSVLHLDRPFDIAPGAGITFDAPSLAALVREAAGWLHAAGLRHGDRVVIVKENHFDMVLIAAGAARIGAVPVLLAPIRNIDHIRIMITRAEPRLLVVGAAVLARAREAGIELAPSGVRMVVIGEPHDALPSHAMPLAHVRGAAEPPVQVVSDDEPMVATHTSGTTGVPKLVLHTANTSIGRFPPRLERIPIPLLTARRSDVVASAISFAHIRGLAWTVSQLSNAPRALVAMSDPRLDTVAPVLEKHRPTILETLPNVFQYWEELIDARPELFAAVRLFISTFDAVHPRTVRKFLGASRHWFPVWGWGLGQSEITGITVNLFTRYTVRRTKRPRGDVTNIGWPALVGLRLVDENGRPAPRGKPGLLMVSTKARCLTYLGEPDRYQSKVQGKWWNSGDLGERAGFGRIRLIDREVDFIPGASSIELESTLLDRLESAADVVVLGVPGGLPVPVLCMRDNRLDPVEWERAVSDLPPLDSPRLVPWADVPRTGTWKVRRSELRERLLGDERTIGSGLWT